MKLTKIKKKISKSALNIFFRNRVWEFLSLSLSVTQTKTREDHKKNCIHFENYVPQVV